jgi:hypothetical protein
MKQSDSYPERDIPVAAEIRDGRLWVTLKDERIISVPLKYYSFLEGTPEQQANMVFSIESIHWPDLDEDVEIRGLLDGWGLPLDEYDTVEAASFLGISTAQLHRLRRSGKLPPSRQVGEERRAKYYFLLTELRRFKAERRKK